MSFSYNPLRHYDVIKDDVGWYQALCTGCGGRIGPKVDGAASIALFEQAMVRHVESSHGRTAKDFEDWSPE